MGALWSDNKRETTVSCPTFIIPQSTPITFRVSEMLLVRAVVADIVLTPDGLKFV